MSVITKALNFIKLLRRQKTRWKRIDDVSHFTSTDIDYKLSGKNACLHAWELAAFCLECSPDAVVMANGRLVDRARKHEESETDLVDFDYIDLMASGVEEHSQADWAAAKSERI